MPNRFLVPRFSGQGGIGRIHKPWATGAFNELFFGQWSAAKDGNLVPYHSGTQSIGTPDLPIKDLYITSSSLHIGNSRLSVDEGGDLYYEKNALVSGYGDPTGTSGASGASGDSGDSGGVGGVPIFQETTQRVYITNNDLLATGLKIDAIVQASATGQSPFLFFSDIIDNNGVTEKNYYNSPTPDTILSGITVAEASDLKVYLRWDGPNDDYVGSAFINGAEIPEDNIQELGSFTRRFEGYVDNLDLEGSDFITGEANGRISIISLEELGKGPSAINLSIDEIANCTPKPGTIAGTTHLKEGDKINVFADFNTPDVSLIKVFESGLAKGIDFSSYSITGVGSLYRAEIEVEVSDLSGPQSVAIQAINAFGSTGDISHSSYLSSSSGSRDLDQLFPQINAQDPTSYNGRNDGLREEESVQLENSISNWTSGTDTVSYNSLTSDISILNPNSFEDPKRIDYVQGIFSNSDNASIEAVRVNNGAVSYKDIAIKIANGPSITGSEMDNTASSTQSPNTIGLTEVKGGDVVNSKVRIQGNGTSSSDIQISVLNQGISDGSQSNFSSYPSQDLSDGSFEFSIPLNVYGSAGQNSRDGSQTAFFVARNNFNTESDYHETSDTAALNNTDFPILSISSTDYPLNQQAIKSSESATVNNSASDFDSIEYTSPNSQITISNPNAYEPLKNVDYSNGGYNIEGDGGSNNIKISANREANGFTTETLGIVNIANTPLSLSIQGLAQSLKSSPTGETDSFSMNSDQIMIAVPSLSLAANQTVQSQLVHSSTGTGKNSNSFAMEVGDGDTKGTFNWVALATNLAGIETISIATNPTYTLAGFSSRTVSASPNSIGAGLAEIGTSVANTNNFSMENISEGGTATNGGTLYTYKSYPIGTQLDNSFDENNNFTICDSTGAVDPNGSYLFNLDKLNRSANTSVANPASFVIEES